MTERTARPTDLDPDKLIAFRSEKGWSTAELAARTSKSFKTVEGWTRGVRSPQPGNLVELAEVLGVKPGDLLRRSRPEWHLVDLRVSHGLQHRDVVAAIGLGLERYRHIEYGVNPLPPDVAQQLADLYQTTPSEVVSCWERSREALTNPTTQ